MKRSELLAGDCSLLKTFGSCLLEVIWLPPMVMLLLPPAETVTELICGLVNFIL